MSEYVFKTTIKFRMAINAPFQKITHEYYCDIDGILLYKNMHGNKLKTLLLYSSTLNKLHIPHPFTSSTHTLTNTHSHARTHSLTHSRQRRNEHASCSYFDSWFQKGKRKRGERFRSKTWNRDSYTICARFVFDGSE